MCEGFQKCSVHHMDSYNEGDLRMNCQEKWAESEPQYCNFLWLELQATAAQHSGYSKIKCPNTHFHTAVCVADRAQIYKVTETRFQNAHNFHSLSNTPMKRRADSGLS